ncbi:hypothetical protein FP568_09210 [Pandoraea pnomenusa]|uniref:hypothetical protein n=1 Tax=Pandoraea pnomenusa TaxID=93220 RepID=UPI0011982AE8|nr:hypothetical protein [Pandoraea pnomenusa]QDX21412.1 hypothetical protein FP568_09210 [Pandoraea pnomenusa]
MAEDSDFEFEVNGCYFWTDALQEGERMYRGRIHVTKVGNETIEPPFKFKMPETRIYLEDAHREATAHAKLIAASGAMKTLVEAWRSSCN